MAHIGRITSMLTRTGRSGFYIKQVCRCQGTTVNLQSANYLVPKVEEVQIPTPWGHIAGKWWGPKNVQPILALHGWQDNCGTWDTLIPLLPAHYSVLAIDLPGHGLSSHLPKGVSYSRADNVITIQRIVRHYGWNKVSLLSHSMGAIAAFVYTALFPERVNYLIAFDSLNPLQTEPDKFIERNARNIHKYLKFEDLLENSKPPTYPYEELINRWHIGTQKSVSKEGCRHLLKRGSCKSETEPDRYYFSRDTRLKINLEPNIQFNVVKAMARKIICPVLNIKAQDSQEMNDCYFNEVKEIIMRHNSRYEFHVLPGSHHVHLDSPATVLPSVIDFIKRQTV